MALLLVIHGYRDSFLLLNGIHMPLLDYLMFVLTWFGDSLFIGSLVVLVFPRHISLQIMIILSVAVSGLLAQALKQWLFSGWDRPLKVFDGQELVHFIGNYKLYHRSFPSGHSVTTGAAFTVLAGYLRDKKAWVIMCGLFTVMVSYTRIYLGSHFPGDVLAGSMLGTGMSVLMILSFEKKLHHWITAWPVNTTLVYRRAIGIIAFAGIIVSVIKYLEYLY